MTVKRCVMQQQAQIFLSAVVMVRLLTSSRLSPANEQLWRYNERKTPENLESFNLISKYQSFNVRHGVFSWRNLCLEQSLHICAYLMPSVLNGNRTFCWLRLLRSSLGWFDEGSWKVATQTITAVHASRLHRGSVCVCVYVCVTCVYTNSSSLSKHYFYLTCDFLSVSTAVAHSWDSRPIYPPVTNHCVTAACVGERVLRGMS